MRRALFVLAFAATCSAQTPVVKGVGNFIHDVADLDQSAHFYRDVLGVEMQRPPSDWQTTEAVLKMYGAAGGKFRVASAQVAGVAMRIELVEFQGVDRKPVKRGLGDPGAAILMLTVADLEPLLDRLAAAKVPMTVNEKQACDGRGVAVADPDGFPVLLIEQKGKPAAGGKTFTDLRFGYTVTSDALLNGPLKALQLEGGPVTHICQPIEEALLGSAAPPAIVTLPGDFEIWLAKASAGKKSGAVLRPQDPGAAVLRLMVTNADAAVRALSQAGAKVVSEGGAIQTLPPAGLRAAILQAPDNLFLQVVQ